MGPEHAQDITDDLTPDQIDALFAAFEADDFPAMESLLDGFEEAIATKEGGADRNRGGAEKLRRYWTVGKGGQEIRWGTPGDWTRCVEKVGKHLGERAKGYCALRHKEMDGYYPGDKRNLKKVVDFEAMETKHYPVSNDEPGATDMQIEYKDVAVRNLDIVDETKGIVEAIVSVTNIVDEVNDRILPGAYTKTLGKMTPKGVWSHAWEAPISKTIEAKELMPGDPNLPKNLPNGDPWPPECGAVMVKMQFNLDTQRGRDAFSDIQFFAGEQQWSIGYHVPTGGSVTTKGIREISTLDWYEYSPVLHGAMPLAHTLSVKSAQEAFKAMNKATQADDDETEEKPSVDSPDSDEPAPDAEDDVEVSDGDEEDMENDADEDDPREKKVLSASTMELAVKAVDILTQLIQAAGGTAPVETKENPGNSGEYDTLADAVKTLDGTIPADVFDNLVDLAEKIDTAYDDDDDDALEALSNDYLDVIESAMDDTDDENAIESLADASEALHQLVQPIADEEGGDDTEDAGSGSDADPGAEADVVTDAPSGDGAEIKELVVLDLDEIRGFLADPTDMP